MDNITIEELLNTIRKYDQNGESIIKKAYDYAENMHRDQTRKSGEPYIIHPLNVAYTLAQMHADSDTICAGLLHDTIEDSKTTVEDLTELFNSEISKLVDGVTKISRINFTTKSEQNLANSRKIITSLIKDVRIIIIKLADRLHNMQTLQYQKPSKQVENSYETLEIYVPLAYSIGAYRLKSELEDLAFKYINPNMYKQIQELRYELNIKNFDNINEMKNNIQNELINRGFNHEIIMRTKNIYGIYKSGYPEKKITDITDLFALKVMLDDIDKCYLTLGIINKYKPVNGKFKDYIANPKTNKYQSLHTTVFGAGNTLIQTQIRTFDMDRIACYGITAYWDINKENAREQMQNDLKSKYQFYKTLLEINEHFSDNQEFMKHITQELLSDKIYVYKTNGEIIELPIGSTIIDFAYRIGENIGEHMIEAIVNGRRVPYHYVLKNKDRVQIITNKLNTNSKQGWENIATTTTAKRRIKIQARQ